MFSSLNSQVIHQVQYMSNKNLDQPVTPLFAFCMSTSVFKTICLSLFQMFLQVHHVQILTSDVGTLKSVFMRVKFVMPIRIVTMETMSHFLVVSLPILQFNNCFALWRLSAWTHEEKYRSHGWQFQQPAMSPHTLPRHPSH